MISNIEQHIAALETIIRDNMSAGDRFEGNCIYGDGTFNRWPELLPKQRNLAKLGRIASRILEIGFNAGHSALIFLSNGKTSKMVCFDLGEHLYTRKCFEYLSSVFPGRLEIVYGDSAVTIPEYIVNHPERTLPFDVAHIDGSHQPADVERDIRNVKYLCRSRWSIVVYDDIWMETLTRLYINLSIGHRLLETYDILEPTRCCAHITCRYTPSLIAVETPVVTKEILEYCVRYNYDLLISDPRPGERYDGYEFILWLRSGVPPPWSVIERVAELKMYHGARIAMSTGCVLIRVCYFSRKMMMEPDLREAFDKDLYGSQDLMLISE